MTVTKFGINLNILECKLLICYLRQMGSSGINLNILECKYIMELEPKWVDVSINLNILECKCCLSGCCFSSLGY